MGRLIFLEKIKILSASSRELRQRVLAGVQTRHSPQHMLLRWWPVLAAACLLAVLAIWGTTRPPAGQIVTHAREIAGTQPANQAKPTGLPTLLAYNRALCQSPEALDRLLTVHGNTLLPNEQNVWTIFGSKPKIKPRKETTNATS